MTPWLSGLGYLAVVGSLVGAWLRPDGALLDPVTLFLVLGSAVGYTLICHRPAELAALNQPLLRSAEGPIQARLVELARRHRLEGARGLEVALLTAHAPLEIQGLKLLAAGAGVAELESALRRLAGRLAAEQLGPARVWQTLARGAVNTGVTMSLLSMAQVLANVPADKAQAALAATFGATVCGLLVGWFVAAPQALRRRRAAEDEARRQETWIEGLVAIAAGVHPRRLADQFGQGVRAA